jgi:hypothetical protein
MVEKLTVEQINDLEMTLKLCLEPQFFDKIPQFERLFDMARNAALQSLAPPVEKLTAEEVAALARKAKLPAYMRDTDDAIEALRRFAGEAMEEAAMICDALDGYDDRPADCAAAIRRAAKEIKCP